MPDTTSELNTATTIFTLQFLCSLITKTFDGNRIDLHEFIANCDSAFNLSPFSHREALMAYVISRITGSARAQLRDKRITSWDELKELLLKLYSDKKHYTQLMEELNTIKQNMNENILNFYNRIDKLCTRLLNTVTYQDVNERLGRIEMIKELSLQRFILHSTPEISRFLRSKEPKTLSDALNSALEEERALQISKSNFKPSSSNKFCSVCKTKTHNTKDCYKNKQRSINFNSSNSQSNKNKNTFTQSNNQNRSPNSNSYAQKTCNYCKKPGHLISECYKRKNRNGNNGQQADRNANISAITSQENHTTLNEGDPQNDVVSWGFA